MVWSISSRVLTKNNSVRQNLRTGSLDVERGWVERENGKQVKMNPKRSGDATTESHSPAGDATVAAVVTELIGSLKQQKLYREVTLALRSGLRDARAEVSFLRVRGLRCLLNFLRSVSESDSSILLFCQSQSIPDLQGTCLSIDRWRKSRNLILNVE